MAAVSGTIAILSAAVLPPEMPYLSKRALTGLRDYKYVAGGYTLLDDLHQPFWNWVVTLFPMWLAPNLITLLGTAWLLLAYCVSAYYTPNFEGAPPQPPHFLVASTRSVPGYVIHNSVQITQNSDSIRRKRAVMGLLPQRLGCAALPTPGLPRWQAGTPHKELLTPGPALRSRCATSHFPLAPLLRPTRTDTSRPNLLRVSTAQQVSLHIHPF